MRWLLIGYMFLFIHRPFEVYPALGSVRIELMYMLLTGFVWLVVVRKRWLPNPLHAAYGGFALAVLVCWLASPWLAHGQVTVENYFKLLVFYLLLVTVVNDERGLRQVVSAFLIVLAVYMGHSLWEYLNGRHVFRMGIARLVGVDTSLGDPNAFGATILYSLPLAAALWRSRPGPNGRLGLAGFFALAIACIALTGSRSAFVGLLLWVALVTWRSRWRVPLAAALLLAAPILWLALPASLQSRFETIINPEAGPANARLSAESRLDGLRLGLEQWAANPATGCGPGAWRKATGATLQPHNLYGQVLGEMGSLGAVAFFAIVLLYWRNTRRIVFLYRCHPEWGHDFLFHLNRALGMALVLLLFEGNFGHSLFRYTWVWYGGFLIIARFCVEARRRLRHGLGGPETQRIARPRRLPPPVTAA